MVVHVYIYTCSTLCAHHVQHSMQHNTANSMMSCLLEMCSRAFNSASGSVECKLVSKSMFIKCETELMSLQLSYKNKIKHILQQHIAKGKEHITVY